MLERDGAARSVVRPLSTGGLHHACDVVKLQNIDLDLNFEVSPGRWKDPHRGIIQFLETEEVERIICSAGGS